MALAKTGTKMADAATYRRYAEECRYLAKSMTKDNARRLLEIARWMALAEEEDKSPRTDDER
jgi:hypothetical protein